MNICCLDMEGVLTPEIWDRLADTTGIDELHRTTRDEPDYERLMAWRIDILRKRNITLHDIQKVIESIEPLPGARAFLDELRTLTQVIILSDTFEEFAMPLMAKLGWPTIFCNSLILDERGMIRTAHMRCEHTKLATVRGLQAIGFETLVAGDSYNDLAMIRASKAGFLFRTTDEIKAENPDLQAFDTYVELVHAFKAALASGD